jgi:hypothetical protein
MTSIGTWLAVVVVVAIALLLTNEYGVIEKVATILVALFSLTVVGMSIGIQFTPLAWSGTDLASGLSFQIAAGTMGIALAMFGMTGVGAYEISTYSFWCVEKGYAQMTGANDGSEGWAERARGWIAVMKKDAFLSWFIYSITTAAFYVLGAAVLHPAGLVPEGTAVLETLVHLFTA